MLTEMYVFLDDSASIFVSQLFSLSEGRITIRTTIDFFWTPIRVEEYFPTLSVNIRFSAFLSLPTAVCMERGATAAEFITTSETR
jgi:hypothetical protein